MSYETRFFYFRRFSTTGSDTSCPDGSAFLPPCIVDSDASALRRRHSNGHHCVEDVFHHHWCCVLLFSFSVLSPHHSSAHSRLLSCTDFHTRSYYFHFRGRSTDAFAISCFICLFLFRLHWARALHRAVALFTLLLRCAVVAGPFYCEKVSSDPPKIKKGEKWSAGKNWNEYIFAWTHMENGCFSAYWLIKVRLKNKGMLSLTLMKFEHDMAESIVCSLITRHVFVRLNLIRIVW